MRPSRCALFIILDILIALAACLLVIPERAGIHYLDPKYGSDAKMWVERYGRRSKYYINLVGTTKQTWGNNVTYYFVFFEYLHNEYRRSFVEMRFKTCDMLNVDPYVGKLFKNAGAICPLPPGHHEFMNMSVPMENFTMLWPFKKGRVDITLSLTATGATIANGSIHVQFQDNERKKPTTVRTRFYSKKSKTK